MTCVNCAPTKNFSPNTRFGVDARTGIAYIKRAAFEQCFGWVAQLVEQGTENPRVRGSIPFPATRNTRAATFGLRPFLVSGQLSGGSPSEKPRAVSDRQGHLDEAQPVYLSHARTKVQPDNDVLVTIEVTAGADGNIEKVEVEDTNGKCFSIPR